MAWESLEKWARLEIQDWLQELMVVLFQKARVLAQDGDTQTVTKLIFRTYQQHQNDEWTSRSLDLIDRLCLEGIAYAGREFEQFER